MKKIIIIPVREDSKRLPGKALLEVNGLPLWYHTYLQCAKSNVNEIYITTDSIKIMNQCHDFNVPPIPTGKCWCGTERVAKAYQSLVRQHPPNWASAADLILNVQADYPQISPKSINLLLNHNKYSLEQYDFITLYCHLEPFEFFNPNIVKVIGSELNGKPGELFCHYFTRFDYPHSFGHIGLYLFQPCNLQNIITHPQSYLSKKENLEQNTWLSNGAKIKALYTDRELSVDTQKDFERFKQETENGNGNEI